MLEQFSKLLEAPTGLPPKRLMIIKYPRRMKHELLRSNHIDTLLCRRMRLKKMAGEMKEATLIRTITTFCLFSSIDQEEVCDMEIMHRL